MTVKIGDRVIYRPRVPYGRQSELFGFVTRVIDAETGVVDIIAFPAGGEFQSVNNVAQKNDQVQIHCWEPHVDPLETRIAELECQIANGHSLADIPELQRRGPGRPRKDAA